MIRRGQFGDQSDVRKAISLVSQARQAFISSETGSGKTAAYGLPVLHHVFNQVQKEAKAKHLQERSPRPLCLVLTPTADLASQVFEDLSELGRNLDGVSLELVTGAVATSPADQVRAVQERQAEVLVATPGRLLRFLQQHGTAASKTQATNAKSQSSRKAPKQAEEPGLERLFSLAGVRWWVIDECDRMARMGLFKDVLSLFPHLPRPSKAEGKPPMQVLMSSATMTEEAQFLLRRFAPRSVHVDLSSESLVPATVKHVVYHVTSRRKHALLAYLLRRRGMRGCQALIFTRTRLRAERLAEALQADGFPAAAIHAECTATQRWRALTALKDGDVQFLVTTDVLGRGIHVPGLPLVVNYDLPLSPEDYVHRVGRTGRMGEEGMAISFVNKHVLDVKIGAPGQAAVLEEEGLLAAAEKLIGKRIERRKVPGPWRDVDRDVDISQDQPSRVVGLEKKKVAALPMSDRQGKTRKVTGNTDKGKGREGGRVFEEPEQQEAGTKVEEVVRGMDAGIARRLGIKRTRPPAPGEKEAEKDEKRARRRREVLEERRRTKQAEVPERPLKRGGR